MRTNKQTNKQKNQQSKQTNKQTIKIYKWKITSRNDIICMGREKTRGGGSALMNIKY